MTASKIPIKKVCEHCGEDFIAHKTTTRYCSHQCNSRAYKESKRKKRVRKTEYFEQEKKVKDIVDKPYLTIAEAGRLIGVTRQSIYRYIYSGRLKAYSISDHKSIVRREDIEKMLAEKPYEKRQPRDTIIISELYNSDEVCDKYNISRSTLFAIGKRERIPKTFNRGKSYWSKKHIDSYFAKKAPDESIEEWCTVEEIQERFGMTKTAVYSMAYDRGIPKKKIGSKSYYSLRHVEEAKGVIEQAAPEYYTVNEAMAMFGITRDQLYHYTKRYKVPKIKKGRTILIAKRELDEALKPPTIFK